MMLKSLSLGGESQYERIGVSREFMRRGSRRDAVTRRRKHRWRNPLSCDCAPRIVSQQDDRLPAESATRTANRVSQSQVSYPARASYRRLRFTCFRSTPPSIIANVTLSISTAKVVASEPQGSGKLPRSSRFAQTTRPSRSQKRILQ